METEVGEDPVAEEGEAVTVTESEMSWESLPYVNVMILVATLFALTVAFNVADVDVTEVAESVVTVGAGVVVKLRIAPVAEPASLSANNR